MNEYIYLYDGSWIELLSLINYLLKENKKPLNIKEESKYTPNLIDQALHLNIKKEKKIYQEWIKKVSRDIVKIAYYVYLSNDENKELIIYYFLKNGLKYKDKVKYLRNLKCVNKALSLTHYVFGEAHRMKGFLRFQEMKNGFLYAQMEPENNIICLLTTHFKKRLPQENWLICDEKRKIYAFYDTTRVYFLESDEIIKLNLEFSKKELDIEDLWKTFFKTIAIKERKNTRAQRNFMPLKYRKYMLETDDENEKSD